MAPAPPSAMWRDQPFTFRTVRSRFPSCHPYLLLTPQGMKQRKKLFNRLLTADRDTQQSRGNTEAELRAFCVGTVSLHCSREGKEAALSCPFKTQAEEALGLQVLQISNGFFSRSRLGDVQVNLFLLKYFRSILHFMTSDGNWTLTAGGESSHQVYRLGKRAGQLPQAVCCWRCCWQAKEESLKRTAAGEKMGSLLRETRDHQWCRC